MNFLDKECFIYSSPIGLIEIIIENKYIVSISKMRTTKGLKKKNIKNIYKYNKLNLKNFSKKPLLKINNKFNNKVSAIRYIKTCLDYYFSGKDYLKYLPLNLKGTDFQKKVWNYLRKIPFGEKKSYCEVAQAINKPKAYRAVGTACGKNPCLLTVPCHRVVGKNGLGGFALGLSIKKKLIKLENSSL